MNWKLDHLSFKQSLASAILFALVAIGVFAFASLSGTATSDFTREVSSSDLANGRVLNVDVYAINPEPALHVQGGSSVYMIQYDKDGHWIGLEVKNDGQLIKQLSTATESGQLSKSPQKIKARFIYPSKRSKQRYDYIKDYSAGVQAFYQNDIKELVKVEKSNYLSKASVETQQNRFYLFALLPCILSLYFAVITVLKWREES